VIVTVIIPTLSVRLDIFFLDVFLEPLFNLLPFLLIRRHFFFDGAYSLFVPGIHSLTVFPYAPEHQKANHEDNNEYYIK